MSIFITDFLIHRKMLTCFTKMVANFTMYNLGSSKIHPHTPKIIGFDCIRVYKSGALEFGKNNLVTLRQISLKSKFRWVHVVDLQIEAKMKAIDEFFKINLFLAFTRHHL